MTFPTSAVLAIFLVWSLRWTLNPTIPQSLKITLELLPISESFPRALCLVACLGVIEQFLLSAKWSGACPPFLTYLLATLLGQKSAIYTHQIPVFSTCGLILCDAFVWAFYLICSHRSTSIAVDLWIAAEVLSLMNLYIKMIKKGYRNE